MVARILVGRIRGTPCPVLLTLLRRDPSTKGVASGYCSSWMSSLSSSRCPGLTNVQLYFPENLECTRGRRLELYRKGSRRTSSDFAGSKCYGRSDRDCRRAFSSTTPHPAVEEKDRPRSDTEHFIDLRVDRKESLFPEGFAGGRQGEVAEVLNRGTVPKLVDPTETYRRRDESKASKLSVMRREASAKIMAAMDAFAAGGTWGGDGWELGNDVSPLSQGSLERTSGGPSGTRAAEEGEDSDGRPGARAATAGRNEGVDEAVGQGEELGEGEMQEAQEVDSVARERGPKWEEAASLAERGRRALPAKRRVVVLPQQASMVGGALLREVSSVPQTFDVEIPSDLEIKSNWENPKYAMFEMLHERSFLLTGRRGSGKSCALNQIVLHARSTGWIVVFVPDAWNLMHRGRYCLPSPTFDGMYDVPVQSMSMLTALKAAHGEQLKTLTIQDPEVQGRHEGVETLLDLVERGAAEKVWAGTAHLDVMRELMATTDAKILLAIDSYNELFQPSMWHYGDNKLEAPHLTVTHPLVPPVEVTRMGLSFVNEENGRGSQGKEMDHLDKLQPSDWEAVRGCLPTPPANGMTVCATTSRYPIVRKVRKKLWAPFEKVAEGMIDGVSIPVEPLSLDELAIIAGHFADEEIVPEPLNSRQLARVHAKSEGLAEKVYQTCAVCSY